MLTTFLVIFWGRGGGGFQLVRHSVSLSLSVCFCFFFLTKVYFLIGTFEAGEVVPSSAGKKRDSHIVQFQAADSTQKPK